MLMRAPKPAEFRMTRKGRWQTVVKRGVVAAKLRLARKNNHPIHRLILVGCFAYQIGDTTYYPIWS